MKKCEKKKFVCLYSGGKDCVTALSMALTEMSAVALIYYMDIDNTTYNHDLRKETIIRHSESLEIPLEIYCGGRKKIKDLYKLEKILKKYKEKGAQYLVTGTNVDHLSDKINSNLAKFSGLNLYNPLSGISEEKFIKCLKEHEIEAIITEIDPQKLSLEWLGAEYNEDTIKRFKKTINFFGDEGEFDTTVIGAKQFKKKFNYSIIEKKEKSIELSLHFKK